MAVLHFCFTRSEEHTSELQSHSDLVCRLLLEKKKHLSYASNGPGSAAHLIAELMKTMLKIEMTHVPYKGNAPALNDVVAGHVSIFFFNDTATTEIYTLSLHDALPISRRSQSASPECSSRCVPSTWAVQQ